MSKLTLRDLLNNSSTNPNPLVCWELNCVEFEINLVADPRWIKMKCLVCLKNSSSFGSRRMSSSGTLPCLVIRLLCLLRVCSIPLRRDICRSVGAAEEPPLDRFLVICTRLLALSFCPSGHQELNIEPAASSENVSPWSIIKLATSGCRIAK